MGTMRWLQLNAFITSTVMIRSALVGTDPSWPRRYGGRAVPLPDARARSDRAYAIDQPPTDHRGDWRDDISGTNSTGLPQS